MPVVRRTPSLLPLTAPINTLATTALLPVALVVISCLVHAVNGDNMLGLGGTNADGIEEI